MRIGLYINAFGHGGAERVVSRLSSILFENGHDVFVVISDTSLLSYPISGTFVDLKIPASKGVFAKVLTVFKRTAKLRKIKKSKKLDSVISFLDGANTVNVLAKCGHTKNLVSIRNYQSAKLKASGMEGTLYKFLLCQIYRKADSVVCVSYVIAQDVVESFKVPQKKVSVLYNPYDIASIERELLSIEVIAPEIVSFIQSKNFVFVSTGRLMHQKGFWHLLKVFHLLNPSENGFGLVIIGNGEQEKQLKELAILLGIEKSVMFCGYQKNPYSIMKLCSVYVLSSLFEGFPNAMVEAMCLGLPIIAADCKSGPREILAPELDIELDSIVEPLYASYGLLMPPLPKTEDWSTQIDTIERIWAAEIMKWNNDSAKLSSYANKSVERARDFSYSSCLNKLLEIVKSDE